MDESICWVGRCPHCGVVWCVDSKEDPRLTKHGKPQRLFSPGFGNTLMEEWRTSNACASVCMSSNQEEFERRIKMGQAIATLVEAATLPCPGDRLRIDRIWDNREAEPTDG